MTVHPARTLFAGAAALVTTGLTVALLSAPTPGAYAAVPSCSGQTPTLVATEDGQRLDGTAGADVISTAGFDGVRVDAKGGDDLICSTALTNSAVLAGAGHDTIIDEIGPTSVDGYLKETWVRSGPGDDRIVGGPATKTHAAYLESTTGVVVRLDLGTVAEGPDIDTLVGIHHVQGSNHRDLFVGSAGDDVFDTGYFPRRGTKRDRDVVRTGAGDDTVTGRHARIELGPGDDEAVVASADVFGGPGDDRINLETGGAAHGGEGADVLSSGNDFDEGGERPVAVRLLGGPGPDRLQPATAYTVEQERCPKVCARSFLDGGTGRDTLVLVENRSRVDLAARRYRAAAARARLRSLENVLGTPTAEVIRGDGRRNVIEGKGGNDVLAGRGGRDVLLGGRGRDRADGGPGRDRCQAERVRSC
ncbi:MULTISPECIES: calcium-binding protein [unclassified Nocardioides]|uniref:calcium-binding protein n=1 Tax=unclassified Nocardioides TaxID=2615069 RepID=UPI0030153055